MVLVAPYNTAPMSEERRREEKEEKEACMQQESWLHVPIYVQVVKEFVDLPVDDLKHSLLSVIAQGVKRRSIERRSLSAQVPINEMVALIETPNEGGEERGAIEYLKEAM
jgi:hypothetical protein